MHARTLAALTLCIPFLFACAYSKTCNDGVCEITENGKTRYEGDPAKIAALQKQKADAVKADAALQAKIDAAPRRGTNEPVRVAVVPARGMDAELFELAGAYSDMIRAELAGPGIELVDAGSIARAVDVASGNIDPNDRFQSMNRNQGPQKTLDWGANGVAKLRRAGLAADVVLFTWLKPQEKTGFVGARGSGAGLAQVVLVEFDGRYSSLWNYKELGTREVGTSSNSLAVAGFSKEGKYGAGQLKGRRNPEGDRAAVKRYAATIRSRILSELRPRMPSLAALRSLQTERQPASEDGKGKIKLDLRKLFR